MSTRVKSLGESGAVAVWVAGTIAVMIGMIALSMDLGRTATTDTELKWASDAAALAGARQLDGDPGARDRARKAATGAVSGSGVGLTSNSDTFSNSPAPIQVVDVKFLTTLGPGEGTAGDVEATSDANAHYIQVVVEQKTVNNLFIEVVGGSATSTVQESSVAGYGAAICQIPPLMLCNPNEDADPAVNNLAAGTGVLVKANESQAKSWAPGDFGLLQIPGQPGNNAARTAFASKNGSPICFNAEKTTTEPGEKTSVSAGINVRLDIYNSPLNQTDAWIGPPAKNVVSGWTQKQNPDKNCNPGLKGVTDQYTGPPDTTAEVMPYPRDNCFYNNTCADPHFGNGVWDRSTYCAVNHPGGICPPLVTTGLKETKTRYGLYRAEIEQYSPGNNTMPNNPLDPGMSGSGQSTSCYKGLTWDQIPPGADVRSPGFDPAGPSFDRRVLTAAVVNCKAANFNGRATVPVAKWILLFITEPAGYVDPQDLFLEVIRTVDMDKDKSVAHKIVQLYR
jgi:Flp pilus assembly protein TadG